MRHLRPSNTTLTMHISISRLIAAAWSKLIDRRGFSNSFAYILNAIDLGIGAIRDCDLAEGSLISRCRSRDEGRIGQMVSEVFPKTWVCSSSPQTTTMKNHATRPRVKPAERSLPSSLGLVKAACAFTHLPGFADLQTLGMPETVTAILVILQPTTAFASQSRIPPSLPPVPTLKSHMPLQRIRDTWKLNTNELRVDQARCFGAPCPCVRTSPRDVHLTAASEAEVCELS